MRSTRTRVDRLFGASPRQAAHLRIQRWNSVWPPAAVPVPETHPLQPLTAYGSGKAMAELYLNLHRSRTGLTAGSPALPTRSVRARIRRGARGGHDLRAQGAL